MPEILLGSYRHLSGDGDDSVVGNCEGDDDGDGDYDGDCDICDVDGDDDDDVQQLVLRVLHGTRRRHGFFHGRSVCRAKGARTMWRHTWPQSTAP